VSSYHRGHRGTQRAQKIYRKGREERKGGNRKKQKIDHKGHPFDSPFAGSGSLRAGYGTRLTAKDAKEKTAKEGSEEIAKNAKIAKNRRN
jgi:hypothetical protein